MFGRLSFFVFLVLLMASFAAQSAIHHDIKVELQPANHTINVTNVLTLGSRKAKNFEFFLHGGLKLSSPDAQLVKVEKINDYAIPLNRYQVNLGENQTQFTLHYSGQIYHPVKQQSEEYARSFSETPGIIGPEGVFLSQASYWYPVSNGELITFTLDTKLPTPWQSVSQGERQNVTSNDEVTSVVWEEKSDQEEIYLVAAPYEIYQQAAGAVTAMVYLQKPDSVLAQKYLDATAQYIEMYRQLIGPYPYTKFALVENFWETGYGMPSFTLLGPTVIRLPFIISTSYPHEILHNWWGNSVYVDFEKGNWAEGLTAYLADHLTREQRGQGSQYRRQILQHYTDFVDANRDFPLTEFRSRHSSATEAVGYGKTQMVFHMLRQKFGDELFEKALHRFYFQFRGKVASFSDWQSIFNDVTEADLSKFFRQWVERTGAPQLRVEKAIVEKSANLYELAIEVSQVQKGEPYEMDVPVAITVDGSDQVVMKAITLDKKNQTVKLSLKDRPLGISVDPLFDVFRRVDLKEIPPALSQAFGAEKALIILPSKASDELRAAYRQLAESWQSTQDAGIEIKLDSEVTTIPDDRAVWVLDSQNKYFSTIQSGANSYTNILKSHDILLSDKDLAQDDRSIILVTRNKDNPKQAVSLITTKNINAIPGLARKLPHYRKYSYLAFEGDEPTNTVKGQYPVNASPMQMAVTQPDGQKPAFQLAKLPSRQPLAQVPTVFSEKRMMEDVKFLASKAMAGRGLGTKELDKAAEYIAQQFEAAGLQPGYPGDSTYLQTWSEYIAGLDKDIRLTNVVGYIPGTNPNMKQESVVVSAHYDHLGLGWPDVRKGNEGKIHYGADDNASGVAVMLELARMAAKKWQPERAIVFVAFTAEEAGMLGSNYYIRNYRRYPADKIIGVLNLDTVGRLGDGAVSIFNADTATEWQHIFRGAQFVTGVKVKMVTKEFTPGDQKSFIDAGVPAVQLFGSVHSDFHAPGDTVDKVDSAGLVKVTSVLKEAVEYLASRPDALTSTITSKAGTEKQQSVPKKRPQGRKVSVGTVPDFAYNGNGVRITGVTPNSPAEKAGLKEGDVITALNERKIKTLADYAKHLRKLKPGDEITLEYIRDTQNKRVTVEVADR